MNIFFAPSKSRRPSRNAAPFDLLSPQGESRLQDVRLNDDHDDHDGSAASDLSPTMSPRPARFRNAFHECLFVLVCTLAAASFSFLQRSLVVILDPLQMAAPLRMPPAELSWTVAGPGLAAGGFFLPMVYLVEKFGGRVVSRRWMLVGGLLVYSLLVGVCAAAVDGVFLDVMVALAGVACALHLAAAMSILASAYPFASGRKTAATAFFVLGGGPSAIVVGSLVSGIVQVHFGWRGPFVFLAVLSASAAVLSLLVVPDFDRRPKLKPVAKAGGDEEDALGEGSAKATSTVCEFDWRGTVLLVLAVGLFTVALTSAPETHDGWSTPYVWLLFAISLMCLGMFVYWERVAEYPMIPPPVWDSPGLLAMLLFVFLIFMAGCALIFWLPLFMEQVQMQSPFQTAIRLLPAAVTGICISPLLTLVVHRMNYSLVAAVSALLMIGSNVALMYLRSDRDYWATTFPATILSTLAVDWTLGVATAAFSTALPLQYQTAGLGLVITVARLAIPAGLAVTTAIHTSFVGRSDITYPEVPYTNVFYATLSLAVLALTLVPFLHFDNSKPPLRRGGKLPLSMMVNVDPSEDLGYRDFIDTLPSLQIQPRKSSLYANLPPINQGGTNNNPNPHTPLAANTEAAGPSSSGIHHQSPQGAAAASASQRSSATGDRVIWLVCEDCGASKRMVEQVGDPVRYFYDGGGGNSHGIGDGSVNADHQRGGLGKGGGGRRSSSLSGDTSSVAGASATSTVRRLPPLCKDLNSLRGWSG